MVNSQDLEKEQNLIKKSRLVKRKKCKCGRRLIYAPNVKIPLMCGVCKTIGLEASKKEFLQVKSKSKNTIIK